jgi:glycine cleavage system aminomethyltransferase T
MHAMCLEKVTSADISNAAFPFGHIREIAVFPARRCGRLRVTYVGELGWELHIPIGAIGEVFDTLMHAGKAMGYPASRLPCTGIASGWRKVTAPGVRTSRPTTPRIEAGLGWAVRRSSNSGLSWVRRRCNAIAGQPLTKRFAGFVIDDPEAVLVGRETILRNGRAGWLSHLRWLRLQHRKIDRLWLRPQPRRRIRRVPGQMAIMSSLSHSTACRQKSASNRSSIRANTRVKA